MSDLFNFVLTPEQQELIRQKRAEKAKFEAIIEDDQRKLVPLNEWLNAVAKVTGENVDSRAGTNGGGRETDSREGINMTEAIEKIANNSTQPVPRKTLREMLAGQGFPGDRLGNYFYTVVHRLKEKKRITVRADGSVWRAPAPTQN